MWSDLPATMYLLAILPRRQAPRYVDGGLYVGAVEIGGGDGALVAVEATERVSGVSVCKFLNVQLSKKSYKIINK